MELINQVNKHRKEVKTDSFTPQWKEIISSYKDGDLIINPDFQRLFRWSSTQQTAFIESILLGIPVPPLFFIEEADSKHTVIDGVQRISTILKFFSKEIFADVQDQSTPNTEEEIVDSDATLEDRISQISDECNIKIPSVLLRGTILQDLKGYSSDTLPEALKRSIKYSRIPVILLTKESDPSTRYEVFMRLNKAGSLASDQEIRNCSARIYDSKFPDQLRELASDDSVRNSLCLSSAKEKLMGVDEAVLRLLAFYYSQSEPKHDINTFLDDFMKYASQNKFKLTDEIKSNILETFKLISENFDSGKGFKSNIRSSFSTNLFDVFAIGVYHNIRTLNGNKIKELHSSLLESDAYKSLVGPGSNTRKKILGRIELGKEWFAK